MSQQGTYQVRVWAIKHVKSRRRPWGVRWVTSKREHSEWYATKALAESFRTDLIKAQRSGEQFDVDSGMPHSIVRQRGAHTLVQLAIAYIDWTWKDAAPNTRRATVSNLAAAVTIFCRDLDGAPDPVELQNLLGTRLLPPPRRPEPLDAHQRAMASWVHRASRPLSDLLDDLCATDLLAALARAADGRTVTYSTWDKRRAVLHRCLGFAVASGWLPHNPMTGRRMSRANTGQMVDPRVVVNPAQARQLLAAVTYVRGPRQIDADRGQRLYAFFASLYYAGLRPGEAMQLSRADLILPNEGWGEARLAASRPQLDGAYFADSPERRRPLKRRRPEDVRPVPLPPHLVSILRWHLNKYGTTPDGRLFSARTTGGGVTTSIYTRIWHKARSIALSSEQVASPLARRPYDLRHAALSSWLNAGVPAPEVAERAGHSVAVLLRVYAKCLHGQRAAFNARIETLLSE